MADLFSHLAKGTGDPEAVQPRLKTRFEDGAYASAEKPEEAPSPTDFTPAPSQKGTPQRQATIDAAAPDGQLPIPADHAPVTPRQAADGARPDYGEPAPAVEPAPPAARQPLTAVSETIIEKAGTVLPGGDYPALPGVPELHAGPQTNPPIKPAPPASVTALESTPPSADQAPTIEVHIGRIEIRRPPPQVQEAPAARPSFEPPLSLSAYLARRNGGGE